MSERRLTNLDGFRVYSEHAGSGDDVVLLHGLSGSHRWWRFTAPVLARTHAVHVVDLIGFGRSRRAPRQPGITDMAMLVTAWMREQRIERPHVVGHSMGGQIAIHIAAGDAPLRSLALIAAAGVPRTYSTREVVRFVASALPPRAWGAPHFIPTIALDALRAGPRTLLRAGLHLLADDVTPLLANVDAPTLVIWGELDPLLPVAHGRRIADGIASARFVVVEGAAHNVMCDRPAELNRLLLDFMTAA